MNHLKIEPFTDLQDANLVDAEKIDQALRAKDLRQYVDAIEDNPATPGEVVIWCGMGHPITTIERAVAIAQRVRVSRTEL